MAASAAAGTRRATLQHAQTNHSANLIAASRQAALQQFTCKTDTLPLCRVRLYVPRKNREAAVTGCSWQCPSETLIFDSLHADFGQAAVRCLQPKDKTSKVRHKQYMVHWAETYIRMKHIPLASSLAKKWSRHSALASIDPSFANHERTHPLYHNDENDHRVHGALTPVHNVIESIIMKIRTQRTAMCRFAMAGAE